MHFRGPEDDRDDYTASRITFRPQAGGHRQSRLAICTFHLGFSLGPRLASLACEVAVHPDSLWWTAPMDRSQQVLMLTDSQKGTPPLKAGSDWESYAERLVGWRFTSTLNGEHSCLDAIVASGIGDWPQVERRRFMGEIHESARVLEITGPADWHTLCVSHPHANQHPDSPAGVGTLTPDWRSVATQWDGVHLPFWALLTVPFVRYISEVGNTMMWSWDTEGTIWLPGEFLRAGAPLLPAKVPEFRGVAPLMSADLGFTRGPQTLQAQRTYTSGRR